MDSPIKGEFQFTNVGRAKANFKVTLTTVESVIGAVRPYLMSRDVDFDYDPEKNEGKIFVGGLREVGQFHRIDTAASESIIDAERAANSEKGSGV